MDYFNGTPYSLPQRALTVLSDQIQRIEKRVSLLREEGFLTQTTLKKYYGHKRFEQIAESNALEGSTLSAGETELVIAKGVTLTGHDPAYIRDAKALDEALKKVAELARRSESTDISQLHELHRLILGERQGAGVFRNAPVKIRGSQLKPPRDWQGVMNAMEEWQEWSQENTFSPVIRAAVLHAWLTHVHPFLDGNGRTARAISNLELFRAGLPPIIIRKKERNRYLSALSDSDQGGDLGPFLSLIIERTEDALEGLILAAKQMQGYNEANALIRQRQEKQLKLWETNVNLLVQLLEIELTSTMESVSGTVNLKSYMGSLDLDMYLALHNDEPVSKSWCYEIEINVPAIKKIKRLLWVGYRSPELKKRLGEECSGVSLFWSEPNPDRFPPWLMANDLGFIEISLDSHHPDKWHTLRADQLYTKLSHSQVVKNIASAIQNMFS